MDLETLEQEMAKLRAPTPDISEAEMSKTPLPPDNREDLRAELDAARRRDGQEPGEVVRCSEMLADLERREADEWAKLCTLEEAASKAEWAARTQHTVWAGVRHDIKAAAAEPEHNDK